MGLVAAQAGRAACSADGWWRASDYLGGTGAGAPQRPPNWVGMVKIDCTGWPQTPPGRDLNEAKQTVPLSDMGGERSSLRSSRLPR